MLSINAPNIIHSAGMPAPKTILQNAPVIINIKSTQVAYLVAKAVTEIVSVVLNSDSTS